MLPFVPVPLVASLLEFRKLRRAFAAAGRGFSITFEFVLPTPLPTLWTFADPPSTPRLSPRTTSEPSGTPSFGDDPASPGPTVEPTPTGSSRTGGLDTTIETPVDVLSLSTESVGPEALAWLGMALVGYALVAGVLAAGYVGGIDRRLRDEPASIPSCIAAYAPRFILYNLLVFGAFLLTIPVLAVAPALLLLAIPIVAVVSYVFYPAPFLFVVDDAGVVEAFCRSVRLTTSGGPVLSFALWHVGATVVASVVLSLFVSAGGAGILLALVGTAPFVLVLTAATVSFLRDHVSGDGFEAGSTDPPSRPPIDGHGTDRNSNAIDP
ncbi:hypothetical protein [Natrinema salifodinae]|uniref:hypothetical protein n=1 Tax=Natrinema salifodinae TaxID=1202768 RepID=UPI000A795A59|nr:hypothetical protein [Natrinema salifodinae]